MTQTETQTDQNELPQIKMYTVEYTAVYADSADGFIDTQRYSEVVWADDPTAAIAQVQQIFNEEARLCDAEQGIPTMQWENVYENVSVMKRSEEKENG